MQQPFLSIEEFNELLTQWNGRTIKISKLELDDLDETTVALETITYATNTRRLDDYEPMHALQLNGTGSIHSDTTDAHQILPSSLYEIPIEDDSLYEFDGTHFLISTSRGVYKIELAE